MAGLKAGIVGAGIAGASCAGTLAAAGWEVDVFEQSQQVGGRLSAVPIENGWVAQGTPFISARRDPFRSQLREWVRRGWLAPVRGNVLQGRAAGTWVQTPLQNHYRPAIDPAQLVRSMLGDARLHTGANVASLRPRTIVLDDGQALGPFDCVICSVPAPQALPMIDAIPRLQERLSNVHYRPTWVFLMRWTGGPEADIIQFDDALLKLAVRQPSPAGDLWAVYSTPEFAETYLEVSSEEACTRAASALMGVLGLPHPVAVEASRLWREARPEAGAGDGFWLSDRENRVALIGDGIAGVGVERAWESGTRFAQALVQAQQELAA